MLTCSLPLIAPFGLPSPVVRAATIAAWIPATKLEGHVIHRPEFARPEAVVAVGREGPESRVEGSTPDARCLAVAKLSSPEGRQLARDIAGPIPKALLERPAELLRNTLDSDKDFVRVGRG